MQNGMPRAEFEQRLNEVLDARENPALDPQLRAAAEQDDECREILAAAEALAAGITQRAAPELPNDLAAAVLRDLQQASPPARFPGGMAFWIPASIAALVLVAFVARQIRQQPAIAPLPDSLPAFANSDSDLPGNASGESYVAGGELPTDFEPVGDDYFAMLRRTGQAMAIFPDTIRRADMPPEVSAMAEGMRPVRNSVTAAFDALRGALPTKSPESES